MMIRLTELQAQAKALGIPIAGDFVLCLMSLFFLDSH